jgi:flagellar protein FlaG
MVSEIDTSSINKYQQTFEMSNKNNTKVLSQEELKNLIADNIPKEEVQHITDEINKMISSTDMANRRVELRVNESINRVIILVYNKENNEILREIPCKELQNLAVYLKEAVGLFYDKQV